jgi:hypothetical protein
MPFFWQTVDATIETDQGPQTMSWLKYATLDDGIFGKTSTMGFLVDGKINGPEHAAWADALLDAGSGIVTTKRRQHLPVSFRVASDDERRQAMTHINEVRPAFGTRTDPENFRIIVMEVSAD